MKITVALLIWGASWSTNLVAAEVPRSETSAQCVERTNASPTECFVRNTKAHFESCRLFMQLVVVFGTAVDPILCAIGSHTADHYQATLKQFAGNPEALNLTKSYYALWRASMSSMVPNLHERKVPYDARTSRHAAELDAAGERLLLEK